MAFPWRFWKILCKNAGASQRGAEGPRVFSSNGSTITMSAAKQRKLEVPRIHKAVIRGIRILLGTMVSWA